MKIKATCQTCGREFYLSQIGPDSDAPGRCPFCGARFARHYSTILVDAVREAEATGSKFVHALGRLESLKTGFDIDVEGVLEELAGQLRERHPREQAG